MNVVAARKTQQIARPLKVLIPLIQSELQQGDEAGEEHYANAGDMLIESKDQVGYGRWGTWISKNFELSHRQANRYMQMARSRDDFRRGVSKVSHTSLRSATGEGDRERAKNQSSQHQAFRRVLHNVARDTFVQERQARDQEVQLHRDLAEELIDIGYRALATKLHPDRGGTKDAMARLNRVRDELKSIAQTRRYV